MKPIERVAVYGMGAVGAVYAYRLHKYLGKENVAVLCKGERKDRYKKTPFCINGETIPFYLTEPESEKNPYELILIGVKYEQLSEAVREIAPCVGKDTIILSLLNGIDTEEELQKTYGEDKVPRCFVVGIDTLRKGTTINFQSLGQIFLGFDNNSMFADHLARIGQLFDRVGIPYVISDQMKKEQWWKFMLNAAMNQISAVLNIPYGPFQSDAHVQELSRMVCEEVKKLAQKEGVFLDETDMDRFFKVANKLSATGITSMCADVRAKRQTEVEMLSGVINRLGRKHGIPTPCNTALYHMIQYIQSHYPIS